MPMMASNNIESKDTGLTTQNSSDAINTKVAESSNREKTAENTQFNIFVKSATIDLGYLITATATTTGIKRSPSFHRYGKQRKYHARSTINTIDPDDSVQFQLSITCNKGTNRSVSRPLSRFVKLRNDLIEEQQRHRHFQDCSGSAPLILPELPLSIIEKLSVTQENSSAAHGFTAIQNLLQGYYRPAMAQWFDAVTQTCSLDSSPTFQEFLCDKPCMKNESTHTETTHSSSHDSQHLVPSKSTSLHSISEDMVEDMHTDDEQHNLFMPSHQSSSNVYCTSKIETLDHRIIST